MTDIDWVVADLENRELSDEIVNTLAGIESWCVKDHGYESKNKRIAEHGGTDTLKIVNTIFATALLNTDGVTYQTMIGYISGMVKCKAVLDRIKCAAELIAIAYINDLIVITRDGDQMIITTLFELDEEVPVFQKHVPEFTKPKPVKHLVPILGNRFKKHKSYICLDHINKMNAVELCLERRVIDNLEEATTAELETDEQVTAWKDIKRRSKEMYDLISDQSFYLKHNYDTRGRCYCEGYYVNYQGSSYKKAIVQLHKKEIVQL